METWLTVLLGLAVLAVGSGVVAWAASGDDWVDRMFGPEERLRKCEVRLRAPNRKTP